MKADIIIAAKDAEKTLGRAIRSARAQTLPLEQFSIIVVDDGSSKDNTRGAIQHFGDWVRPIFFDDNRGLPTALNAGILSGDGQYVGRLDSDDVLMPEYLRFMCYFLDHNKEYDWVRCDYFVIDERENILSRGRDDLACCFLFRRHALESIGMYNEEKKVNETLELFQRLLQDKRYQDKGGYLPVPLYKWFKRPGSLTNGGRLGKL